MTRLAAAAMLDLWQAAEGRPPVERALVLAAVDGEEPELLARLPLGRRDARLLALHAALGGRLLEATAPCPACGELSEFSVDPAELPAGEDRLAEPAPVEAAGFVVSWRPLDSTDVAAAAGERDAGAAERVLLSRCVTDARGPEGSLAADELPTAVREALGRAMAEADPLGEVLVDAACPACETVFVADLDLAGFVWTELGARAHGLLREIDVLARTYGWTEPDVLALDERRRAAYVELAREGSR